MLHTYLLEQQSTSAVEVMTIDASEPVLWQARALRQLPIEELTLIPFSPTALIPCKDGDKIKRPTTLHPSLPFHIVCETGAADLGDSAKFIIKTPIGGKLGNVAPPPFWCVLEAMDDADANMEYRGCTINNGIPSITIDRKGKKHKKPKLTPLTVTFKVLVNIKPLERGECLVVKKVQHAAAMPVKQETP